MFIQAAKIKNFRLFEDFEVKSGEINIPDSINDGSGLTVFVGENGTGKTTLLDALALPLISYKSDLIGLEDFYDINDKIEIKIASDVKFTVKKTMPRGEFQAIGFNFYANLRARHTTAYPVGPLTNDTKYIPDPGENIDNNSVELRASVENPYSGPRFKDNDYLYIDKNRNKQLESGMFSTTRFDRLLNNFNFQYLKANHSNLKDPNSKSREEIGADSIDNKYLSAAFDEFKELCGYEVDISLINNQSPYSKAYLSYVAASNGQLPVSKLGNGYQMFLAILCQYHLNLQSGKQSIIFIDEAELHLHSKLQKDLARLLLQISKNAQVVVTTHSAEVLKSFLPNTHYKTNILRRNNDIVEINPVAEYVLPTPSVNESAYIALGVDGIEYFNELYGYLMDIKQAANIKQFDGLISAGQELIQWENNMNGSIDSLSIHSCLRHKIHHPENRLNDEKFNFVQNLPGSITFLRNEIKSEMS